MSELDGPDGSDEPGDDDGGQQPHDAGKGPEPADNPGGYPGASVAARIEAEDRLPLRGEAHAATWSSPPRIGHGGNQGDQGQPEVGEAPLAAMIPGDRPTGTPRTPGAAAEATAAEHEIANVEAPEVSPAERAADAGSAAETDAGERLGETPQAGRSDALTGQATQSDDGPATPDTAPDAGLKELMARLARYDARLEQQDAKLEQQDAKHKADIKDLKVENEALKAKYEADVKELKAEYQAKLERRSADNEARVKDLEAEFQTLKDGQRTAPDTPGNHESEANQSFERELPAAQQDPEKTEHEDDRKGLGSNANYQLYGAAGGLIGAVLLDMFVPGISRVLGDIIVSGPAVIAALVPVRREGWREKHDDSLDKP